MNRCPNCGKILSEEEKIIYKCTSCGKKIESEITTQNYTENTIAKVLKIISIIILILGTIGSFAASFHDVYGKSEFSFATFLIPETVVVISGILFLGFSEVIKLLQEINNKLNKR
jgi:H+/gluconate symporter-like permease